MGRRCTLCVCVHNRKCVYGIECRASACDALYLMFYKLRYAPYAHHDFTCNRSYHHHHHHHNCVMLMLMHSILFEFTKCYQKPHARAMIHDRFYLLLFTYALVAAFSLLLMRIFSFSISFVSFIASAHSTSCHQLHSITLTH